ncbi:DUF1330 domain-containing protein [Devosia sp.]|uniref:DUF1330 domain-containing protein n=1 Tax=Devosia sp. TaxID=1871048 RepID=UPI002EE5F909
MGAKGYWVVGLDVEDAERYATYSAFVRPFLAANGGRFVVAGGQQDVVEGMGRRRTVLVEFPSYADAVRVYRSDGYQKGMQDRIAASVADFVIVEGLAE